MDHPLDPGLDHARVEGVVVGDEGQVLQQAPLNALVDLLTLGAVPRLPAGADQLEEVGAGRELGVVGVPELLARRLEEEVVPVLRVLIVGEPAADVTGQARGVSADTARSGMAQAEPSESRMRLRRRRSESGRGKDRGASPSKRTISNSWR